MKEDSIRAFGADESEGRMMSEVTVVESEGCGGDGEFQIKDWWPEWT